MSNKSKTIKGLNMKKGDFITLHQFFTRDITYPVRWDAIHDAANEAAREYYKTMWRNRTRDRWNRDDPFTSVRNISLSDVLMFSALLGIEPADLVAWEIVETQIEHGTCDWKTDLLADLEDF